MLQAALKRWDLRQLHPHLRNHLLSSAFHRESKVSSIQTPTSSTPALFIELTPVLTFRFFRYIEGLHPDRPEISNWRHQLRAKEENTPLPAGAKLPVDWLGDGVGPHGNAVSALWAMRDLMMQDSLSLARTLEYHEVCDVIFTWFYDCKSY